MENKDLELLDLDLEMDSEYMVDFQAKLEKWAEGLDVDLEDLLGEL